MDRLCDIRMSGVLAHFIMDIAPDSIALVNIVRRPVVLGPGRLLSDLTIAEQLDRSIDWEATARHSFVLTGITLDKDC